MNKISQYILVVIFLSLSFIFSSDAFAAQLKIGVVVPLSGPASSGGETVRNSILMAKKMYDANDEVSFIFEDDQFQAKNTVTSVKKLIFQDKVNGLMIYGTPNSLAVNSIAEQQKIPMVAFSILDRVVLGKNYVFKHWVSSQIENALVVEEARKRAYRKVAVIASTNDAMLALRDHFINSKIFEIVYSEDFPREETDFRTQVAKIREVRPDAVYNLLWSPQPGIFSKALRDGGFKGPIFGVHNLEDPAQIEASAGSLEGSWFVTGDDSAAVDFYKEYKNLYGKTPTAGGPNAFDVAKMYIESRKSKDLTSYFHNLNNFNGAYGIYGASGKNDFTIRAKIKWIKGNNVVSEVDESK